MPKEPLSPAVRRKRRKARLVFYGGFLALLWGFWVWIPQQVDFIPKAPPNPNPPVDPERSRLFAPGTRILLVTAHPDDSEFYIGGTLTQLGKAGAEIHQAICTDGDKAYYWVFANASENRTVRRREARAAATAWGGKEVVFLGYPDGRLRTNDEAIARLQKEIERIRPDYVIGFDPDYPPKVSHQDHRRSGEIALEAARRSGIPKWVLLFSSTAPNFVIDTTDDWERRQELLKIHASQFHDSRLEMVTNMVAHLAEVDGERIGVAMGEGFRVVKLK